MQERSRPGRPVRQPLVRALTAFVLTLGPALMPGPGRAQDVAEPLDRLLRAYAAQRQFSGAALVARSGEVVYRAAFGPADVEREIPNSPDSRFRIGSLAGQFIAALALELVEDGVLRLDASVREYLPEYPAPKGDRITIRALLTYTSGLPDYPNLPDLVDEYGRDPTSPEGLVTPTRSLPLELEPGTRFNRGDSGYVLLGRIIEEVTGKPLDRVLKERMLEPLGLRGTGFDQGADESPRSAFGHTRTLTGYERAHPLDAPVPFAAAMYSTVDDLLRWTRVLYAGEVSRIPESKARTLTPDSDGYGDRVAIRELRLGEGADSTSVSVIEAGGRMFGFASSLRHFPDDDHTIVLLDNTSSDLRPIVDGITNILYGRPAPAPRRSIAERILPVIESAGVEAGLERYRERRRTRPDEYAFGPRQLLLLARHYLQADDTTTALTLLEANVDEHPELPAPRFALAQLLAATGDTLAAVTALEGALTRRPGLVRLLSALRDLGVEPDPALRLPVVDQPRPILERYVGTYQVEPGVTLAIGLEDDGLTAQRSGGAAFRLLPQAETLFLLHGSKTQFAFDLDSSGAAVSVSIAESGQQVTFPKVD